MTKNDEIRSYFYGIDTKTFKVRTASVTYGGSLTINSDINPLGHTEQIGDRDPSAEIALRFGLSNIEEFPANMLDAEWVKSKIQELEDKAAEMETAKSTS